MSRHVVTFHYTLRDPSGHVLDMSTGGDPVSYLEGAGQIIDGLDEQLRGVPAGTKKRVLVPAAQAYGLPDPERIHKVGRAMIPFEGELNVGDRFQTEPDPGSPVVTIASIDGDEVTLDANHPLAGVDLTFDVEILAVRAATAEELAHGHAHGEASDGGCGCGGGGECGSKN
jgi:FKBP-type peptidyl-prolyl cis-trans isomerase SlyD